MNNDDLIEDSDSSDDDYVPDTKPNEQLSEVDSDGDPEEPTSDNEDRTTKKRKRKPTKSRKKQKLDVEEIVKPEKKEELTEEEKKKKDDELWADFLKDTGFQSKNNKSNDEIKTAQKSTTSTTTTTVNIPTTTVKRVDKVKITQVFEFAGEEVKVEKEVARDSAEARLLNKTNPETSNPNSNKVRIKGGGLGGISNVLSQLGKKPKISTLEKSKLDWDQFKKEENIDEELRTFNKGKDGYLEKQDFLQRADLRRFEIEKEVRSIERSKRLNNTL